MRRTIRSVSVLVLSACLTGVAAQETPKAGVPRINFIANEGIMLTVGKEMAILVDALFRESVEPYGKIPEATLAHMETAQTPFDDVKLVLVTHKHADHFHAESVARFMQHNTEALFVSSTQVVEELKASAPGYDAFADRVRILDPTGNEPATLEVEGIKVAALALSHGSGNMAEVTNLGFLLEVNGKRLLHLGDAELNEKSQGPLAKHAIEVDTACVPYWWLLDKDGREFLDHILKPKSVVAVHIPPAEVEEIAHKIRVHMPEVVVFTRPFMSKRV